MKKTQAQKILDAEIKALGDRISLLTFEEYVITSQFKEAHLAFMEYMDKAKHHSDPSLRRFILKDAIIGSSSIGSDVTKKPIIHFSLGRKDIKFHEKEHALIENLNRQYSWLLVSAYEDYERFLKELYACMGFLDRTFWQCDDYGSISISDIGSLKLAWFKQRVAERTNRRFQHDASCALARFRDAFPSLLPYETVALPGAKTSVYSDAILHQEVDTLPVGLTCSLAGKLRHAIVHDHSAIESAQSLSKEIGANGTDKIAVIAAHLKKSPEGVRIWLVYDQKGLLDYNFLDLRISQMLQSLCAHACLLYKACISHFGEQAYWERKGSKGISGRAKRKAE